MGVGGRNEPGDNATVRVTLDAASGCRNVEQRVMRFGRGRSKPRQASCEDVWYVVSGRGVLRLHPPPVPHCLENTGTTPLRVLGVFHPAGSPAAKVEVPKGWP